jgi:pimeloyl-ACP methyl ester carboxylesterase
MNSHIFQPPSPSYSLSGDGLAPGCRILQKGEFVFVLAGEESAPLALVWLHGNASDCGFESAAIALLAQELDAFVIGVEWPGYGPSSHVRPSVEGTNAASLCALEIAGARRILVAGRSLGTGPAALLASELTLRNHVDFGLVLWSPISSVAGVSAGVIGSFLSNFVPKRWDVLSDVSNLSCPVLVIAGTHDTLTPLSMAKEVFQACGSMKKVFHTVNKATHNDGYNFDELIHLMKDLALESTEELETSLSFSSKLSVPKLIASPPLSDMPSECKVVIVGAGPVGLFLGVSLIHLGMRTSDVVLLEKVFRFSCLFVF